MILLPPKISRSKRLAIFDFDWTMVKPKNGRRFPKDRSDWEWWNPRVPDVIRDYARRRYRIVIVTDRSKDWKIDMIRDVVEVLAIPITVVIGFEKEQKKIESRFHVVNQGLTAHITETITELLQLYSEIIVIEDDIRFNMSSLESLHFFQQPRIDNLIQPPTPLFWIGVIGFRHLIHPAIQNLIKFYINLLIDWRLLRLPLNDRQHYSNDNA